MILSALRFPRQGVQSVAIDQRQWETLLTRCEPESLSFADEMDRRSEARHHLNHVMQMFVGIGVRQPSRFMVRTRNISAHGVGFVHSQPARRGMRCTLAILTRDHTLVHLKATLTSCCSRQDGLYDVGVRFDHPLKLEQFLLTEPTTSVI